MRKQPESNWKFHGVRVVHANELDINTAQTPGMNRAAAITYARCRFRISPECYSSSASLCTFAEFAHNGPRPRTMRYSVPQKSGAAARGLCAFEHIRKTRSSLSPKGSIADTDGTFPRRSRT